VSIAVSGSLTPVINALIESESAVYVSAVSGQYNVITELRVPSHDDLYRAIAELRSHSGVKSVSTLVYVDVVKGIFMPDSALQSEIRLDSVDVALIELLERNGRMPFLELAEHTGLSPSAVRNRVNHLISSTALRVGAVVKRRGAGRTLAMGIGVNLGSRDDAAVSAIESLPGIEFLARTLGRYDVIATVAANSASDLHSLSERIRRIDGVSGLESWAHLEVFKEHYARSLDVRD
jgi:DNA-binding Lrp family transcriptional regulator